MAAAATGNENQVKIAAPAVIPFVFSSETDPWMFFLYALTALATKDKHIQRLMKFLDFLGYTGTNDDRARAFVASKNRAQLCVEFCFEILPKQT